MISTSMYLDCLVQLSLFQSHTGDVVVDLRSGLGHRDPFRDGLIEVASQGSLHATVPKNDRLF